ncbi:1-acyl-sn-glycerol-3-phosphate acyltransferase [bacterium]|nr:1-acyl-sn-glycerol-3-phosphate acyltransferase [bacterium]
MKALLILLVRLAVAVFYRRIDVSGLERLPRSSPVLYAANHGNSLADGLVLMAKMPRPPAFASAVFLFKKPVLGWFLRKLGCVPIHRAIDAGADPSDNRKSLAELGDKLRTGQTVAIFPEGISRHEPKVQKIKVGTARLAFGAEEAAGWNLDLHVVPVGLQWEDSPRWRSAARIVVGEPIAATDYLETYNEHPRRAMTEFTRDLESQLRSLSLHANSWQERTEAMLAARSYIAEWNRGAVKQPPAIDSPEQQSQAGSSTAELFLVWRKRAETQAPEDAARISRRLTRFGRALDALGLRPDELDSASSMSRVAARLAMRSAMWIIGLPIAAWGRVNAYIAERAVVAFERRFNPDGIVAHSTWLLIPGLVIAPIFFAIQSAILIALLIWFGVSWWLSILAGLVYFVSLPGAWIASLRFRDLRQDGIRWARAAKILQGRRRLIPRLLRERAAISRQVESLIGTLSES